jgi:N-acetylglucosamine kinase-like BadF-type ATPase
MPARAPSLAVGVDVGGTWIRLEARAARRRAVRTATRVAAVPDLATHLAAVWRARGWSRRDVAALVIASRGVWTPAECRRLARRLGSLAARVRVIPDAQAAALGALAGGPGVLVLSGTGSIVVGHDGRGRWARAGGFGPYLGDEGSGFWLGREWVRATTGPGDFPRIRALAHAAQPAAAIAALAPRVIASARRGDARALRIAREGQRLLAGGAVDVARRLRLAPPVTMSWAGSVMDAVWFRSGLARAVRGAGLCARWRTPVSGPLAAATRMAMELAERAPRRVAARAAGPRALDGGAPMSRAAPARRRRIVITVCPKEPGTVVLPVERGGARRRLDARRILRELQALVARGNLDAFVRVREGCGGGCHGRGPNVSVTVHALPAPGERADDIAIAWRTYVGSLGEVPALSAIIDDNLMGGSERPPNPPGARGAPAAPGHSSTPPVVRRSERALASLTPAAGSATAPRRRRPPAR